MDRKTVNFIKEQYPKGTRIRLNSMEDPYAPISPGTEGVVDLLDDAGQLHMKWDNGRTLALIPGVDSFSVLSPKPETMKLYMPLTADFYMRNRWGERENTPAELYGCDLCKYEGAILKALIKNQMPEEAESGIMYWYDKDDGVQRKVKSVVFTVEKRDNELWGVAECKVVGDLTPSELATLKNYITGQAADGWGEGFEQREISIDRDTELYVHLWNSDDWSIQTEEECFAPKLAHGLPEMCFSTLKTIGEFICIKKGESGYYRSDWDTHDKTRNEELADELNRQLGVTDEQRKAMEAGSMFGWGVPGADPKSYEQSSPQMGGMSF